MVVQFRCPDCQILEVDDEDIGSWVICPYCGGEVQVPDPGATSRVVAEADARQRCEPAGQPLTAGASGESTVPHIHRRGQARLSFEAIEESQPGRSPIGLDEPAVYHIRCDRGFVMEVPREMLGMDAQCPCCDQPVHLDLRNTLEYQHRQEWESHHEENRLSKFWLQWSIVIAALVLTGIVILTIWAFVT